MKGVRSMDDDIIKALRGMNREHFRDLWIKAKKNDMKDVTDEEKSIMKVMLEHEDEYFNEFENADLMGDREFDPETEENPFMHITMHSVVENQLKDRDPIEVYQFYNAMRKKKCSHHETIHMIGAVFAYLLYSVLKYHVPFDLERYKSILKKYKNRKPYKVYEILDEEPEVPS